MNTLTMQPQDELGDSPDGQLPGRPRHKLLNRVTVPLLALLLVAAGFLGGIEVEKGHGGSASASGATAGRFPGRAGAFTGFGGGARGAGAGGARGGFSGGGGFGGFGGGGGAAGGGAVGTISSISGRTIYLKEISGTTIKVTLTAATSLKKSLSVSRNSIRPGDTVTVAGITGKGGSVKASSISDTGNSGSSSGSSSSAAGS